MRQLIVGTTNEAKINQIKSALLPLKIKVDGIKDKSLLPEIEEDGLIAEENARKKAVIYAKLLNETVLSMDNALFFEDLCEDCQPGVNVRRINGRKDRPDDRELLEHYKMLLTKMGEKVNGYWHFAFCVATPHGKTQETTIVSPRIFVAKASSVIMPGYPLESIQIDPKSGKYISEMTREEQNLFWQKTIGKKLCAFVKSLKF